VLVKRLSVAMITVAGAASVLSRLPGESAGASLALPSGLVTKTSRAGWQFIDVGPHFIRS
jgi:hypothetical protein